MNGFEYFRDIQNRYKDTGKGVVGLIIQSEGGSIYKIQKHVSKRLGQRAICIESNELGINIDHITHLQEETRVRFICDQWRT